MKYMIDGCLNGCIIKPEKVVELLGINIDENLDFSIHTEEICKKVGRQLSALRRLSFYLDSKAKLAQSFQSVQPQPLSILLSRLVSL